VARDDDGAGMRAERVFELGREPQRQVIRRLVEQGSTSSVATSSR